jgi:hypothetical protein
MLISNTDLTTCATLTAFHLWIRSKHHRLFQIYFTALGAMLSFRYNFNIYELTKVVYPVSDIKQLCFFPPSHFVEKIRFPRAISLQMPYEEKCLRKIWHYVVSICYWILIRSAHTCLFRFTSIRYSTELMLHALWYSSLGGRTSLIWIRITRLMTRRQNYLRIMIFLFVQVSKVFASISSLSHDKDLIGC